jgi:putative peptide zinc metalloprotease protein
MAATSLWDTLREAAGQPDRGGVGLWEWLKEKVTLAQYRPEPAPGVVVSHLTGREGDYYVLKNPRTKTYYRLGERDYFLWQRMDGAQTVKELVVAYFLEYGSFAFGRAASLVAGLKANLFLNEQPVDVYRRVGSRLRRRRLPYRLSQVWQAFLQRQFAVSGLDSLLEGVYRWGARLFFTWPLQAMFLILSVVGLYMFVRLFSVGSYGVLAIGGSYRLGVIGLIVANLASILIHELSHALTVKHFGREVRRGGFMLYFGMPGFFVDTMDIWMEGKRARLAVTWAGPYSGLVLGGLVSIVMTAWPAFALNALLFQFAFLCYLTVFFNLNPLLELDGYFILMDWLEIPMLRQKSLTFIQRGLWEKLRSLRETGTKLLDTLASFSREERIFAVFGALSALWTAYAIFTGTRFWQQRLAGAVGDLWARGGGVGRTILALGIAAISLLFVVSIGMALLRMVRKAFGWLAKQGLFAATRNVAGMLLVAAAVLALAPQYLDYPALVPLLSLAALAAAAILAWRNAVTYAGSRLAVAFWLLALSAVAFVPSLVLGAADTVVRWHPLSPEVARIVTNSLGHVAYASVFAAGLVLFADTDLGELATPAKALLALGLLTSYGLVLLVAQGRVGERLFGIEALLDVSRALFPLLALILLLPTLFSFWETSFGAAWATIGLALGAHVAGSALDWSLLSSSLFLAVGLFLHDLAYMRVSLPEGRPEADVTLSDRRRLERAFAWTVTSVFAQFRHIAGERRARLLAEQFNNLALAAGWRLSLVQGRVDDAAPGERGLIERGARYADALSLLLDLVAQEMGEKLTVRALQRAYDSLPWEEREIGAQYLFRDVNRAEVLSEMFRATRQDHRGLLRRNPLFATMDETEIDLLISRFSVEHYARGGVVIRQGDAGDTFYIVRSGHVEVTQRDERGVSEVVNQLDRGDYFGELALLHDAPRNATCRATVPTEVLCLSRPDFDCLVRARFSLREKVDRSIARAELLRRMPLFSELDTHQIQLIAAQLREEIYEEGGVIIRQGEIGETFYVIESGRVRVSVQEGGEEHVVAERGRGEYMGEIALLLDVPRTATVRALTETHVLALHKDDFDRLVTDHLYVSRGLERETSRRMIDLDRVAMAA